MAGIQWSDELSVGVKEIDDQHKELIRIANGLINAVNKGSNMRVVNNVITRLRAYTVFHFTSEEKFMEDHHYPKQGAHINEHTRLKQEVKRFQRALYEQQTVELGEVMNFLKGWLLDHLLNYDRELARFIKEQEGKEKTAQV